MHKLNRIINTSNVILNESIIIICILHLSNTICSDCSYTLLIQCVCHHTIQCFIEDCMTNYIAENMMRENLYDREQIGRCILLDWNYVLWFIQRQPSILLLFLRSFLEPQLALMYHLSDFLIDGSKQNGFIEIHEKQKKQWIDTCKSFLFLFMNPIVNPKCDSLFLFYREILHESK